MAVFNIRPRDCRVKEEIEPTLQHGCQSVTDWDFVAGRPTRKQPQKVLRN